MRPPGHGEPGPYSKPARPLEEAAKRRPPTGFAPLPMGRLRTARGCVSSSTGVSGNRGAVAYALQQLINGVTLGMIYGLIAVGYTMVYGIIGMINFAHGDIFMVGAFLSLIALLGPAAHRHHLRAAGAGAHADLRRRHRRPVRLDGRAPRLPPAARLVPPRAADQRDRHVDRAAELRAGEPGRAGQADGAAAARAASS